MVAGGQPSGLTFAENCAKECEEEASLPPDVVTALTPTGLISYKYKTRKGLSTKVPLHFTCLPLLTLAYTCLPVQQYLLY